MALETSERLLKRVDRLSPNEQLLLATRLIERVRQVSKPMTDKDLLKSGVVGMWAGRKDIERVRQVSKPMTGKDLLKSGVVGMWAGRKDIGDSAAYARGLRTRAQLTRI